MVSKYYPKYGHCKQQIDTATDVGRKLGQDVNSEKSFDEIQFEIPITVKKNNKVFLTRHSRIQVDLI